MIDVDLYQPNYQTLMIIYHEFMIKNVKNAWQEKKLGRNVYLLDTKIIDWITDAKNVITML